MIESGDTVVCAVSGGPDSMCLLDSLHTLSDKLGCNLYVAHLHHHMRGKKADKDAQLVMDFAERKQISRFIGHEKVFELAEKLKVGVEEAGRIARYKFLFRLTETIKAQKIAMGHNLNDQAETVIMRLMRGSGTLGLAGIPPVNGPVIRPILQVPRNLIEEYCRAKNLPIITDIYNFDLRYTRNFVRYKVIPELSRQLNPSLIETLSQTARVLRWDAEYIEKMAETTFSDISAKEGRVTLIDEKRLEGLSKAVGSRVLELAWRESSGETGNLEIGHISELFKTERKTVSLPGKITAHRQQGYLGFYPEPPKELDVEIKVPGRTNVPELGLIVKTALLENTTQGWNYPDVYEHIGSRSIFMVELKAWADYNECKGKIRLRTRRPGDKFAPLGMAGKEKKLKDLLISMRVPRYYRDFTPIFTSEDKIVWVGGYRLSERFKVRRDTVRIVEIEIEPLLRGNQNCARI